MHTMIVAVDLKSTIYVQVRVAFIKNVQSMGLTLPQVGLSMCLSIFHGYIR